MQNFSKEKSYKEQLIKRTTKFSLDTMKLVDKLPKTDYSVRVIANQLMRSASSVGANITEGQGSSTRKDFAHFMTHAFKSANESSYWIKLLLEGKKISESNQHLYDESEELSKTLASTIIKLRKPSK